MFPGSSTPAKIATDDTLSAPRQRGRPRKVPVGSISTVTATTTTATTAPSQPAKNIVYKLPPVHTARLRISEHASIYTRLLEFMSHSSIPNLLFYGEAGSGKKSIVTWFLNTLYNTRTSVASATPVASPSDAISKRDIDDEINYEFGHIMRVDTSKVLISDCIINNGIDFVRNDIQYFAKTNIIHDDASPAQFKTVVMYNAEHLTSDAQTALRRSIEVHSSTTRFIMVVRNPERLIAPILSRFCDIYVPLPIWNGEPMSLYKINKKNRSIILSDYRERRREELKAQIVAFRERVLKHKEDAAITTVKTPKIITVNVRKPRGRKKNETVSSGAGAGAGASHSEEEPPALPSIIKAGKTTIKITPFELSCFTLASTLYEQAYSALDVFDSLDSLVDAPEHTIQIRLKYDIMRRHMYNERSQLAMILYYIMRPDDKTDILC